MEIRDVTADDLDAVRDNLRRAFGPFSAAGAHTWRTLVTPLLAQGRYLGMFDGTRLVAAARINPYVQRWHGRPQPMGGIGAVTVAPEDRGRGAGRALMLAVIERCAALGAAVSALYPATTPLYRGVGYEHAGARQRFTVPTEALRTLGGPGRRIRLRRIRPADAPELMAVLARVHASTRASGPLSRDEHAWRLRLADEELFGYLADDGYVLYRWSQGDIEVDNLVAGSEATARTLWSLVGSASSIARSVSVYAEPDDPMLWLLRERSAHDITQDRWMLRIIDLRSALERRGFPAAVTLDTLLEVDDPQRPANSGTWRLRVEAGSCAVEAGGSSSGTSSRVTAGGLSALYAGVPTATLRRAGLLSGGSPETDGALDSAFTCDAYMLDYF